jgi:hypothetical protein
MLDRFPTPLKRALPTAAIVGLALVLTYPCLISGLPGGDDRSPHLSYQHYFDEQVAQGEWYPRWVNEMNYGTGGPLFFLQYPLPYFAAHGLEMLLPLQDPARRAEHALGALLTLASICAGVFTYLWCRTFARPFGGFVAAVTYMTLPYALCIDLYHRVAIGEYLALTWLPLALYFAHTASERPHRGIAGMAAALALLALSHPFSCILFAPVLLSYAIWVAPSGSRLLAAARAGGAALLGGGIAAVYLLPFAVHREYFSVSKYTQLWGALYSYNYSYASQLFPYGPGLFPVQRYSWRLLDGVAIVLGAVAAGLVFRSYRIRRLSGLRLVLAVTSCIAVFATLAAPFFPGSVTMGGPTLPLNEQLRAQRNDIFLESFLTLCCALVCYSLALQRDGARGKPGERAVSAAGSIPLTITGDFFAMIALGSYFLMTTFSRPIWTHFEFLWGILFPWRLNVLLAIATAGLAALAARDVGALPGKLRALVAGAWIVTIGTSAQAWQVPRSFSDLAARPVPSFERERNLLPGYAAISRVPSEEDYRRPFASGAVATVTKGAGSASGRLVGARRILGEAACEGGCTVTIRQTGYPAWRARTAAGIDLPIATEPDTGLMELALPAGTTSFEIALPRGRAESWGARLSALSALGAVIVFFWKEIVEFVRRLRPNRTTSGT